ncbi:MAG: DUF393 domain-containing protein [Bacteroidetes bacterium]|nr:DUF393 domain-containing protein [Bacteroidota bacterium]
MSPLPENSTIILFDGICNFCNSYVNKIIKHDKKNKFKFATLQSEAGKRILSKYIIDYQVYDSIILIENKTVFSKSTAVLKIAKHLGGLYALAFAFIITPTFIRNAVYDFIAKNRYQWFGKKETCMVPTEEIKSKFIS